MALTKSELIEAISERFDLSPAETKSVLNDLLETIKSTLASGEDLMISGFGKFKVNDKAPRVGRNLITGETIPIDKRRVVIFRCSGKLRNKINGINHE